MANRFDAATATPLVSVVLPCLNEAKTVGDCVRQALGAMRRLAIAGEVVVVDNGSSDGSTAAAAAAGARVVPCGQRGYGRAIIAGVQAARGEWIVMGDADGSYNFDEVERFLPPLAAGADLVMGNRFQGRIEPGAMPWKNRYLGTPLLTCVLNLLFRARVGDSQCGLRGFTRAAFERLRLDSAGMEFASEMLVKAARQGLRIVETPVSLERDKRDRGPHLRPWRDGWRHLKLLLMYSPLAVFLLPGLLLSLAGAILVVGLAGGPVHVGPARFDIHWLVAGLLALLVGLQTMQFGAAARLYTVKHRVHEHDRLLAWLLGKCRVEYGLLAGSAMFLAGLAIDVDILWGWIASGFGALDRVRAALLATALLAVGIQTIAFSFLMAILADSPAAEPAAGASAAAPSLPTE